MNGKSGDSAFIRPVLLGLPKMTRHHPAGPRGAGRNPVPCVTAAAICSPPVPQGVHIRSFGSFGPVWGALRNGSGSGRTPPCQRRVRREPRKPGGTAGVRRPLSGPHGPGSRRHGKPRNRPAPHSTPAGGGRRLCFALPWRGSAKKPSDGACSAVARFCALLTVPGSAPRLSWQNVR